MLLRERTLVAETAAMIDVIEPEGRVMTTLPCGKGGTTAVLPLPDEATIDPADALAEFERDFATLISRPWPEGMTMTVAPLRPELPRVPLLSVGAPRRGAMPAPRTGESLSGPIVAIAPLPDLTTAFSRRAALFGAVTATGLLAGSAMKAAAVSPRTVPAAPGAADARLGAIADGLAALQVLVNNHKGSEEEFLNLYDRIDTFKVEMDGTPSDTLAGVLHKLRAIELPEVGNDGDAHDIMCSICEDITRLHAAGVLA